jgi:class 3 adenylate cyclase
MVSLSFRSKLLLSLIGVVAPLLAATLLAVRNETNQQVNQFVDDALQRSHRAFQQLEQQRQTELVQIGLRLNDSNRIAGALQSAVEEGDTAFLASAAAYDLSLRGVTGIVGFTDMQGHPVLSLLNGRRAAAVDIAVPRALIEAMLARGDTSTFGYQLVGSTIYAVQSVLLRLVDRPMGTITIGSPINDEVARRLGAAMVDAQVCFVANGRCVASSSGNSGSGLSRRMTAFAASGRNTDRVGVAGHKWAFVGDKLSTDPGTRARWVVAAPIDNVLQPFTNIERALRVTGIAALALAVLFSLLLSRGLAGPVRRLVSATQRVARGDYDVHVDDSGKDELGHLARAFNEMTHGLLLKERYRGLLDKVISRDIADEMLKGEISLGGETREVTTFFADIRGFTPMTEGMEPQKVIKLLNEVMEHGGAAVEAAGGVVDKYVGDEIMALFGAPVAHDDDALRAVRAALRFRADIDSINIARRDAGEPPVQIGIGINTGPAVAGNMGSAQRMNYTVLGESVNLAARLCSAAGGSQILITRATLERLGGNVRVAALEARSLRGFSLPIDVFEVIELAPQARAPVAHAGGSSSVLGLSLLCGSFALAAPNAASAQDSGAFPTLHDLGLHYESPGGLLQIEPGGRLELDGYAPRGSPQWLIPTTRAFIAPRISVLTDVFVGKHFYSLIELRADRGEAPRDGGMEFRIEQAYVRVLPTRTDFSIQLGRFASPFGQYPQIHHSTSDPLIRPPLPYDYRTTMSGIIPAVSNDSFINWKNKTGFFRPIGLPPIWSAPYQLGAMLFGSMSSLSFRAAIMNGAPSLEPRDWNRSFAHPSYTANAAWQVIPELRIGASYDRGPYVTDSASFARVLPAGRHINDYSQELIGAEVTVTRGYVEIRGEGFLDRWEVPNVRPDPVDRSYFIQAKLKLSPDIFIAGRFGQIFFNELPHSSGILDKWDRDVRRVQIGAGYRIAQNAELRAESMWTHTGVATDGDGGLVSLQFWWAI